MSQGSKWLKHLTSIQKVLGSNSSCLILDFFSMDLFPWIYFSLSQPKKHHSRVLTVVTSKKHPAPEFHHQPWLWHRTVGGLHATTGPLSLKLTERD